MTTIDPNMQEKIIRYREAHEDIKRAKDRLKVIKQNTEQVLSWIRPDMDFKGILDIQIGDNAFWKPWGPADNPIINKVLYADTDMAEVAKNIRILQATYDEIENLRGQIVNAGYGTYI